MKPEVEEKVGKALLQLWKPLVDSVGIRNIVINDVDDRSDYMKMLCISTTNDGTNW